MIFVFLNIQKIISKKKDTKQKKKRRILIIFIVCLFDNCDLKRKIKNKLR